MEFRFNVKNIFRPSICRITNSLIPSGFTAPDRRTVLETTAYVAEVINSVGQKSAEAQGLSKSITTAERLRNSEDQVIYLMTEDDGKNGLVVGILKVGRKSLYVFDKFGETQHVIAPCVLDFYIHESRQRHGLGKVLFEHMLDMENLLPEKLAIDRPSEKLLGFLRKHYGLTEKIPQMNNFVVYEGFFASPHGEKGMNGTQMHLTASPNTQLFGPQFFNEDQRRSNSKTRQSVIPEIVTPTTNGPMGRYGARNSRQAQCSMAQIIHNKPTAVVQTEPNSTNESINKENLITEALESEEPASNEVEEVAQELNNMSVKEAIEPEDAIRMSHHAEQMEKYSDHGDEFDGYPSHIPEEEYYRQQQMYQQNRRPPTHINNTFEDTSPTSFKHNKQHTGQKNISHIILGGDSKIEFDQVSNDGFGSVKINRPIGYHHGKSLAVSEDDNSSISSRVEHTHTDQGYLDLKFYHNRLW